MLAQTSIEDIHGFEYDYERTLMNARIDEVVTYWELYVKTISNWQDLVSGIIPKTTGCGVIYELQNPIILNLHVDRPQEGFAIADMRDLKISDPHYHINGETEIYIVLEGSGLVVVGAKKHAVQKGSVIVTPPHVVHYTVPEKDLVLAVINTPPFNPENSVFVNATNLEGCDIQALHSF